MSRLDPIRTSHFDVVERSEVISSWLFYVNALLSFCVLLVDYEAEPRIHGFFLSAFGISVLAMFALGLILRLYLIPRAEGKRRQDFFSSACDVSLIHQNTEGYYNNDCKDPIKRMAAQVLENSLFSKEIALRMVRRERAKVAIYLLIWLVLLHSHRQEVVWIVAASQALFSEQLLSKWIRMEWLRVRFERTFDDVYKLFQARPPIRSFNAHALDALAAYETAKASAGVTLSSKTFDELNAALSVEWDQVRKTLGL